MLGATAASLVARSAPAQTWPSGPIRIVVPFPPGGSTDALARLVQTGLQQRLGANIIIENKPGASGAAGTAVFAKSPPDGNTWLIVFDTHSVNPYLMNLQYDTEKDLDPVMLVATAPYLLAVNTKHDFKSLADVLAAAKAKPDGLSYASVGSGSIGHLFMVLLQRKTGVKLTHVPYRGGGPAMNDALGGHVDFIIGSVALVTPQLGSGKLRPIVQTGEKRVPALKDVPTVMESVPGPLRLHLVGRVRAGRHAEADRRAIQQGARRDDQGRARDKDAHREPADDPGDGRARGTAQILHRAGQAVGAGGEGKRHQGGDVMAPSSPG